MSQISVSWDFGRPQNGAADDEARAQRAAEAELDFAGADRLAAYEEYQRQWMEFEDEAPMYGLARVWIAAARAADIALTEGWHNPGGASCTISAW